MRVQGNCESLFSDGNILYWMDAPYTIDFPQSLDIRNYPNVETLLKDNIRKWYEQINYV